MSHQMSSEVLGHYVIRNVTKFQNCSSDNILSVENHRGNILIRTMYMSLSIMKLTKHNIFAGKFCPVCFFFMTFCT